RRPAGLDRPRRSVADLQEGHEARRLSSTGQRLALAAQVREVGARARAVLEEACLADPEIHDAAFTDEVVVDRLDEAGMGLRALVGAGREDRLAGCLVDVPMTLGGTVDPVGPGEAGAAPLRRA